MYLDVCKAAMPKIIAVNARQCMGQNLDTHYHCLNRFAPDYARSWIIYLPFSTCHSALATIGQARLLAVGLLHSNWCRDAAYVWDEYSISHKETRSRGLWGGLHTRQCLQVQTCKHSASLEPETNRPKPVTTHAIMTRMAMFWTCKDGSLTRTERRNPFVRSSPEHFLRASRAKEERRSRSCLWPLPCVIGVYLPWA